MRHISWSAWEVEVGEEGEPDFEGVMDVGGDDEVDGAPIEGDDDKQPSFSVASLRGRGTWSKGGSALGVRVRNDRCDPEIQKHFNLLLWVCVSDNFDVDSLAKSIVEAAPRNTDDGTETAASQKKKTPLDILQNVVSGQRYLLVLDDVWTREVHKWKQLQACLGHGGVGSAVLTTTRDAGVAEMMKTVKAYNLEALKDKFIKEIIEARAFSCFQRKEDMPSVFVNMVDEIVKRCRGSPLAATALGSVLGNKTCEEEWKAVSNRSSICTEETGILPILKLSYNDLPSHMKQCFAFCAIFPKDYEIDVEKLIQLWIAHGFIQDKQVRLETIGKQIFHELASRSFFQDVKQVKVTSNLVERAGVCYSRITCKIHDLMHDVALSVREKECALVTEDSYKNESVVANEEPGRCEGLTSTARHLFLSCYGPEIDLNSFLEKNSPAIQTLLCDKYINNSLKHLSKYSSLQALQVRSRGPFPLKSKHLHHLRYLDLSRSKITALPEDMSILYNLQTLNLSSCSNLRGLPKQMKYMTALRHLYTHGCLQLNNVPRDLGKLTSLQTLTCFVAGSGSKCSKIGELGNLNLRGQLQLRHLENASEEDAKAANLVNKKELRELELTWSFGLDKVVDETSCDDDAKMLDKLRPHDGLEAIMIHSYRGTTFPTWLAMLQNFVEVQLFSCKKVQWLFSSEYDASFKFPNLKRLTLHDLVCLERWWEKENDGVQGKEIMFPQLEKLFISDCEKLTALPGEPAFPNLQNVRIDGCPMLSTTVKSPKLGALKVEGRELEVLLWVARHMTSLTILELTSNEYGEETTSVAAENGLREVVDEKEKWNGHDFPLAVMVLTGFKSGVTELCACFVHLEELTILCSDVLVHWPEKEFEQLVSLKKLRIGECNNLTRYAQAPAEPSTSSQMRQLLPCLESLVIEDCDSLIEVFNLPESLRRMNIYNRKYLGTRLQQGQSASLIHQRSSILEVSSSSPRALSKQVFAPLY